MVHFLRNSRNETLIECEVYHNGDLSASINIKNYSEELLKKSNPHEQEAFVTWMDGLNEIRGWWWESAKDENIWKSLDDFVQTKFLVVAKRFDLNYVTD